MNLTGLFLGLLDTHEESVEGQSHNISSEGQHHQVDFDILQSHDETAEGALLLRVDISLTNILQDTELSHQKLLLSEATGVSGQVGQDKRRGDGNSHGNGTLDPEEPAPGGVTQNTIHVGQHTCGDKGGEGVGDEVTAEQDGVPGGELAAGVPLGENEKSAGQEGSLDEAQQETDSHHVSEVTCQSRAGRDQTPKSHRDGDVDRRPLDAVDEHVRGNLHQNVANIQNTETGRVLSIREIEVLLQTLQTSRRNVVAVKIVHDIDQHEQTAPSIQLTLEALLNDDSTSRIDVRHNIPLFGHMLEIFDALLLNLNLDAVVVVS